MKTKSNALVKDGDNRIRLILNMPEFHTLAPIEKQALIDVVQEMTLIEIANDLDLPILLTACLLIDAISRLEIAINSGAFDVPINIMQEREEFACN